MGIAIGIMAYMACQMFIGYWISRKIANQSDFYVAGRSLGIFFASFSIFATWFGAETCIGSSGAIFSSGLSGSRADPFGYTVCLLLAGIFVASQLWKKGIVTIADLFRQYFGSGMEKLAVFLLLPPSLFWAAAQMRAFGQIIAVISPIDPFWCITVASAFVIVYTFFGGLLGDVVSDVVQGVILIVGLALLLVMTVSHLGGLDLAIANIPKEKLSFIAEGESWWARVDAWMIPILGSLFAQEFISRFVASRSAKIARRGSFIAAGVYLSVGLIPVVLGLIGFNLVPQLANQDQFLPTLARRMLSDFGFVIFCGALISAILSTVDSALLSVSAFTTQNLFREHYKSFSEKGQLRLARSALVVAGLIAYTFAVSFEGVYDLIVASSSYGSAGLVVSIFGLLWFPKYKSRLATASTLIVGAVAMPVYGDLLEFEAPFSAAFATCLATYIVLTFIVYRDSVFTATVPVSNDPEVDPQVASS